MSVRLRECKAYENVAQAKGWRAASTTGFGMVRQLRVLQQGDSNTGMH